MTRKETMMRAKNHLMMDFAVVLAMSACNKAKSPDAAANDIAAAQQSAKAIQQVAISLE
jgi:hypothetical protein